MVGYDQHIHLKRSSTLERKNCLSTSDWAFSLLRSTWGAIATSCNQRTRHNWRN